MFRTDFKQFKLVCLDLTYQSFTFRGKVANAFSPDHAAHFRQAIHSLCVPSKVMFLVYQIPVLIIASQYLESVWAQFTVVMTTRGSANNNTVFIFINIPLF